MEHDQLKPIIEAARRGQHPGPHGMHDDDDGIALGEIIAAVMHHKWLIAGITALALLAGLAYTVLSRPVYRADGLLQVEEKNAGLSSLKELQPLLADETSVAAELEILGSRMVLGRVVERLKLDIVAVPRTFPVVGNAVARRHIGNEPAVPWPGLESYAWGGEAIQVDALDVPRDYLDLPLRLVAGDKGRFTLMDDDRQLLAGSVGTRAGNEGLSIFVARLEARPGTQFIVSKRAPETAINELRSRYSAKERGKKSGIIELSLQGRDKAQITAVLDEIQNTYVRQNVERRSAEAEKTLAFLDSQLPALKDQVTAAETAYNSYRQSRGSLDLSLETQGVLKSLVEVEDAAVKLKQERDELRQRFTTEHPSIQAIDAKLARIDQRRQQFEAEVSKLPDTQQTVVRLARDVEVSTKLYTELLNTAQQLRVSKAGTVGDVRVIDSAAVSRTPVGPPATAVLAISALLGLLASMVVIWVLRVLRVVVEDPETIETKLGLPVYATVPHSKVEANLSRRSRRAGAGALLAVSQPDDDAVESLRSLRTTLHFALLDAHRRSLLVTGSSPNLGKSFISKNLAAVLADLGKGIVIVDADLRRGHLHKAFALPRENGITEYITGQATLAHIVKPTTIPNLHVITTGQLPPNPSELLMHERFGALLAALDQEFDTVIIDGPPVLAVSDAAIIGRHVGATLLVARAGMHPLPELEQAVKRLDQAGVQVKGFVFNDLDTERQRYRYGYSGYVYRYSYKS